MWVELLERRELLSAGWVLSTAEALASDAAQADLQVTNTDGQLTAAPGTPVAYAIVVTNAGPGDANGAVVAGAFPETLRGVTFTATQSGGASGFTARGRGNLDDTVNLPVGSTITYMVQATVSEAATGAVLNTATVAAPMGVTDPDLSNNTATDGTALTRPGVYQFVYTSDAHYGITRTFRGQGGVTSQTVNEAMLEEMKVLPNVDLPDGSGKVGAIEFIAMTGDIANRMDKGIQTAAASWSQFAYDYLGLDASGNPVLHPTAGLQSEGSLVTNAPLYMLPGNHDVSNAIGHPKIVPAGAKDPTSMVWLNNLMLGKNLTNETFDYAVDKMNYTKDIAGVHMMFVNMWPDSGVRAWMGADLANVDPTTPVLIFAHDEPAAEIKHFTDPRDPNGPPNKDYEKLLVDTPALPDGNLAEQQKLADFLKAHPNIVGYFHGNDNYNQFYTWKGPDTDPNWQGLDTFRVDSPMKGKLSGDDPGRDESKLSFQLVTLDTSANTLTAREYLWNTTDTAEVWGAARTIRLFPNRAYAGVGDDPLNPGQSALFVGGTNGNDQIQVRSGQGGQIEVKVGAPGENLQMSFGGELGRLAVYGLDGDDQIKVENTLTIPAWLYGGLGDDHIQTGGGPSVVLGGGGSDHIQGNGGSSLLIGGSGADQIQAGTLGDILVHGTTDYDANDAALSAILAEWNSSTDDYPTRVRRLNDRSFDPSLLFWLDSSTVDDDEAADHLVGGGGLDWFFASLADKVSGAKRGEVLTVV